MNGKGHPLPASGEARHDKIPEHVERDKGRGDDARKIIQPDPEAANHDGKKYPYDGSDVGTEAFAKDQASHQVRGQSIAKTVADRR